MIDEPSYHDLRALLKKRLNVEHDNEIDENVKLKSCYWFSNMFNYMIYILTTYINDMEKHINFYKNGMF